ncbi:hypothetical protein LLG95_10640 [bacterium]|nr:hypothetical protein [bacterium]
MVKWLAIIMLCVAAAHGSQVAPRFRVQSSLPSGAMQFEVSDTSATVHVPLWIGGARDAQLYRASSGVIAVNGDIQTDGGAWYATSSGALGPVINGSIAGTFHSEFGFNLPGTTAVGTWNFVHGAAPIFTVTRLNSDYGQIAIGSGSGLQMTQTGVGTASVSGTWDFAGLKVGGSALSFPLAITLGGTGADLSGQTGLLRVDEKDNAFQVVSDNTANWDAAYSHKATEDALNGLVKVSGGTYTQVADNSASWNAAYSMSHTAATVTGQNYLSINGSQQIAAGQIDLSGNHVTGTLPDAKVDANIARGQAVYTSSSPQFYGLTLGAEYPVMDIQNNTLEAGNDFGIQIRDAALGSGYYPTIAMGGTIAAYTHAWVEEDGTLKIKDAGGDVITHDGSTIEMKEPVHVSAVSTAAIRAGNDFYIDTSGHLLKLGNIQLQSNTISTLNTNGNLSVYPNGAGYLYATNNGGSTLQRWAYYNGNDIYLDLTETYMGSGVMSFGFTQRVSAGGGTTYAHMLFMDRGKIGINTNAPTDALDINGSTLRLRTQKTPSSASDTGTAGQWCNDANYIYICAAANTWKRAAISTW